MNLELIHQYKLLHQRNPGYGNGRAYSSQIVALCKENDYKTILDYGCGKGSLTEYLRLAGFECMGYDPAIKEVQNLPDVVFDLVVSNDVLEHLSPDSYKDDLRIIRSKTSGGIFLNISCRPAVHHLPNGNNCHTLVRSPSFWIEELTNEWSDMKITHHEFNLINQNLILIFELKT